MRPLGNAVAGQSGKSLEGQPCRRATAAAPPVNVKLLDSKAEPMAYRETGDMDGASALFLDDVFGD